MGLMIALIICIILIVSSAISALLYFMKGVQARFVKVNTAGLAINLSEIKVISRGVNIAKGRLITGSSIESKEHPYSRLVDDDPATLGHSDGAAKEWVKIDLGEEAPIDKVVIINRKDCCRGRIIGGTVELLDKNGTSIFTSSQFQGQGGGVIPLDFPNNSGYAVYTITLPDKAVVGSDFE